MKKFFCLLLMLFGFMSVAVPIRIVGLYNLTGIQAEQGIAALNGAKLAVEQINAQGGVLNRQLSLKAIDIKSNPQSLLSLESKFKQSSLFVGLNSTETAEAFAKLQPIKSLWLSTGISSLPQSNRRLLTAFDDQTQAAAAAKFALQQLHRKHAIVLYQANNQDAKNLATYFEKAYLSNGGRAKMFEFVGKQLLPAQRQLLSKQRLGVIYLLANQNELPDLLTQIRKAKITTPIIGSDNYSPPLFHDLSHAIADDVYFTKPATFDRNFAEDDLLAFVRAYKKVYGHNPKSIEAALGYDQIKILAVGIKKAKSTSPLQVSQSLARMNDYQSLIGELNFSKRSPSPMVAVMKIIAGKEKTAAVLIPNL